MSMFNEKSNDNEISVAVSRGNLVKIRVVDNKKVSSILMTRDKAKEIGKAIVAMSNKIK